MLTAVEAFEETLDEPKADARSVPSGDTGSKTCLDRILTWLRVCKEKHPDCGSTDDVQLPRRLIHISYPEPEGFPNVRLVENRGQHGRYLCLSHCWGSLRPECITTSRTLTRNLSGIPWDSLSALFQEAIQVTSRLGFEYLWIDSICIIQDSEDDWRQEVAHMADVYANAFLTIAATHAKDGSSGLFSTIPSRFQPALVPALREETYFRRTWIHPQEADLVYDSTLAAETPLLTRAWVFQERQLSPRVLYFLSAEVAWQCNGAVQCECTPAALSPQHENQYVVDSTVDWNRLLSVYTSLSLSFQKDKFAAIGGIARTFQGSGRYIAGLWEGNIYENLCWAVEDVTRPRVSPWHAPTWSWASIYDRVIPTHPNCGHARRGPFAFTVRESFVQHVGPDTFGDVVAAHLIVSAHLLPGRLVYDTAMQARGSELKGFFMVEIDGVPSFPLLADCLLHEPGEGHVPSGTEVFLMYHGDDETRNADFGNDELDDSEEYFLSQGSHFMTIIRDAAQPHSAVYKRIGMVIAWSTNGEDDPELPLQASGWKESTFKLI